MTTPRVSICLPNLNMRPFLDARMESILAQTFTDWELIISDNYSDDGSWEYFQKFRGDPRVRLFQFPREGMYANWNNCIREARGEFIYIATADDTMDPDCLEKMVAALDAHPDCGIAHCGLRLIDEKGRDLPESRQWTQFYASRYFGDLMNVEHIRYAPHDGILHFALATVYTSLTQLVVRRSVFDRVGLFDARFGSAGDFEWDMRAALVENTVHVPDLLATWRVHESQATVDTDSAVRRLLLQRMARVAFRRASKITPSRLARIPLSACEYAYDREWLWFALKEAGSRRERMQVLLAGALLKTRVVSAFIWKRLRGLYCGRLDLNGWCSDRLLQLGIAPPVVCRSGSVTPRREP